MKILADNELKLDVKITKYNQELSEIKQKITNLENSKLENSKYVRSDQQANF